MHWKISVKKTNLVQVTQNELNSAKELILMRAHGIQVHKYKSSCPAGPVRLWRPVLSTTTTTTTTTTSPQRGGMSRNNT